MVLSRVISPYPDFGIAKSWIRECQEKHSNCWSGQLDRPLLPTRVIEVGPTDGMQQPRLIVTNGMRERYVSLSHCWGQTKPLTTTIANINRHLELIHMDHLPLTFQHAVIATRLLGIRYLWIDSLCIIQDSKADWQAECGKMAGLYTNSTVTLAAAASPDSATGFLHRRPGPQYAVHVWELGSQPGHPKMRVLLRRADDDPKEAAAGTEAQSPMDSRAWIYQEMFLSTRVLYVGSRKMYWQCDMAAWRENLCFSVKGETGKRGKNISCMPPPSMSRTMTIRSKADELQSELYEKCNGWYKIVEDYSARQLSHGSDKLPAISGVARWKWGTDAENYIAGIMRCDLRRGLGWICSLNAEQTPAPSPPRRPSWSWISTDKAVDFIHNRYHGVQLNAFRDTGRVYSPFRDTGSNNSPKHITAVAFRSGPDPFGAVSGGTIRLCASCKVAVVDLPGLDPMGLDNTRTLRLCDPSNMHNSAEFFPDDLGAWKKGDTVRCLLLHSSQQWYALVVVEEPTASSPADNQSGVVTALTGRLRSTCAGGSISRFRRVGVAGSSGNWSTWCVGGDVIKAEIV